MIKGFTCGSFDLLHPGHIIMFEDCKSVCDYLIVGVQSDPTIDRNWKNKPIQTLQERILMVQALKFVDKVITYHTEEDLYKILKNGDFDIRIIGSDWENKKYTGGFSPTIISILNQNRIKQEFWGIFKAITQSELEDDLIPGSFLCYLHYYDLRDASEKLIPFWTGYDITTHKLKKDSLVCKDWFQQNPIEKYLTHEIDYIRKFARKNL